MAEAGGFTLIELMVAIGILLVMGAMLIGFLRGALDMSRTGTSRGRVYESAQNIIQIASEDISQVVGRPPHAEGSKFDMAFLVTTDPWGRQIICFTRAWGEELSTVAGYDGGRGSPGQGYDKSFTGRNVRDSVRASGGNIEIVYMFEPSGDGTRLYRGVEAPPIRGGLIDTVVEWLDDNPGAAPDDIAAEWWWRDLTRDFYDRFELVAENVLAFNLECWDSAPNGTTTWDPGDDGPVTSWDLRQRLDDGLPLLPSAVRLTVIIQAGGPIRAGTEIVGKLGNTDTFMTLENTDNFPDIGVQDAFVRVDGELIAYGSKSGTTLASCRRGALGTRATGHESGAPARSGILFRRVIQLPVTR